MVSIGHRGIFNPLSRTGSHERETECVCVWKEVCKGKTSITTVVKPRDTTLVKWSKWTSHQAKSQSTGCNKKRQLQTVKVLPKTKNSSDHKKKKEREKVKSLSRVRTLCKPTDYSPPSTDFTRQEYWRGLSFPPPGDLPNPGIEAGSLALRADALLSEPPGKP